MAAKIKKRHILLCDLQVCRVASTSQRAVKTCVRLTNRLFATREVSTKVEETREQEWASPR